MICVKKELITVLVYADKAVAVVIVDTFVWLLSFWEEILKTGLCQCVTEDNNIGLVKSQLLLNDRSPILSIV